jgi:PAS domain S-box-containing protein
MDVDAPAFAALDLLPEPTLFVDLDGIILSANLACGRQLQQSRDSLARTPLAAIAVDEPGLLHHYLRECARSGQLHMGSLTLRRRDGVAVKFRAGGALAHRSNAAPQSRVVLLRLVPAPESGIAFIALNEKIRQLNAENARRRLIEEDLRKERETLQVTLSSIGDAVIVTDAEGTITFLNEVAESLVGRTLLYARGRPLADIFRIAGEHDGRFVEDPLEKALRTGEIVGLAAHTVVVGPDGTTIPIDDSAAPIRLGDRVIGAVLIFRDISERRRSEQALIDADRRKDEFLATLAHELRNPLAPIRNAVQIISSSADADANMDKAKAVVERQLRHMVRLIDDLMDVSRITRGKLELHRERIDLLAAVTIAAETSQPLLDMKHHTLLIQAARPVFVQADVTRLAQVFANLLNNSAKYSPAGSEISIAIASEGQHAVVSVIDIGVGMPASMLPRIFDMFVQLEQKGPREGLGIGLTLVKRLVELHGGVVEASSPGPGRGSTVRVILPIAEGPPPEPASEHASEHASDTASEPAAKGAPSYRARILVADDNRDAADTLSLILELDGHEVRTAYDGVKAFQIAERFAPQIALLDIGMPNLDGYETARRIREQPWGSAVLLVALTGWGQEQDRRRATEAGFDCHLVKPVELQTIDALIEQVKPH